MIRKHKSFRSAYTSAAPELEELRIVNREPWMADAACAKIDVAYDNFFPEPHARPQPGEAGKGRQSRTAARRPELAAKRYCATCPVAAECLDMSIRNVEIWGIWGGMTFAERCDHTHRYRGHTSSTALLAHRKFLAELNQGLNANAHRPRGLRPLRQGHPRRDPR